MKKSEGKTILFAPKTVAGMISVAASPGTASADYVMQGIDLTLATVIASRAWVTVNGQVTNDKNGGQTDVVLCYGEGAPPANGDPQAGTILTSPASFVSTSGGGAFLPFSLTAMIAEIVPETDYWFDLAVRVTTGNGNVANVDLCAMGLP